MNVNKQLKETDLDEIWTIYSPRILLESAKAKSDQNYYLQSMTKAYYVSKHIKSVYRVHPIYDTVKY